MEPEEDGHAQHRVAWLVRLADQWSQQGGPACARAASARLSPGADAGPRRRRRRRLDIACADSSASRAVVCANDFARAYLTNRHDSAATAGATLRELMARMGHGGIRTALIYLHDSDERQRKLAEALGGAAQAELRRRGSSGESGTDLSRDDHSAG